MRYLTAFLLLFASFTASANLAPMLSSFAPASTTVTHVGGSVMSVGTNYVGKNAANGSVYAFRNVTVPRPTFVNVLKKRAGSLLMNPWLAVALVAADLYYNSDTDEIGSPDSSYAVDTYFTAYGYGGWTWRASTAQGAADLMKAHYELNYGAAQPDPMVYVDDDSYTQVVYSNVGVLGNYGVVRAACSGSTEGYCNPLTSPFTNSSETDLFDQFAPNFSPSQWRDFWKNPETNNYDDVQPMQDAGTDLTSDYNAENDADPITLPTEDPATGDTGNSSVDDVPPEEETELLCDKFPDVLACQELDESPEDPIPVVPEEEIDSSFTSENLSTNSTCPTPGNASIQGQSIAFSYQPVCDLATSIAPLFIAICSVIGLYIVAGGVRS